MSLTDEEFIGSLSGERPVPKVLDARTLNLTHVVAIIDDAFKKYYGLAEDATITFASPVQVLSGEENNKLIGAAALNLEGNQLVADIFIDYQTPERLSIETNQLYPNLVLKEVGNKDGKSNVVIKGISLLFSHKDDRITPL